MERKRWTQEELMAEAEEANRIYFENLKNKYRVEIMALETIVESLKKFKEVVTKFDGKVYNARFNTELSKAFPVNHDLKNIPQASFYTSKSYSWDKNSVEVRFRVYNCFIKTEKDNVYPRVYDNETYYFFKLSDGRIIAESINANIDEVIESRLRTIEKFKNHCSDEYFNAMKEESKKLSEAIKEYADKLDEVTKSEFKVSNTWYLT